MDMREMDGKENNHIDLKNKQITINESTTPKNNNSSYKNFIKGNKNILTSRLIGSATQEVEAGEGWLEKIFEKCCKCNFGFLHQYFQIDSDDVEKRVINSLIPLNPNFLEVAQNSPDLYGPFWIYTTLVFIIAAAGSLTKYLNKGESTEEFFQSFIPVAATLVYGVGFVLPLILTLLMNFFGSPIQFVSVICIYGYSFAIYIPLVAVCAIPYNWLQWVFIGYAVGSSTGFLLINFWKELSKYMENRRYFILGVIFIFQITLFFVLKLHFFAKFKEQLQTDTSKKL